MTWSRTSALEKELVPLQQHQLMMCCGGGADVSSRWRQQHPLDPCCCCCCRCFGDTAGLLHISCFRVSSPPGFRQATEAAATPSAPPKLTWPGLANLSADWYASAPRKTLASRRSRAPSVPSRIAQQPTRARTSRRSIPDEVVRSTAVPHLASAIGRTSSPPEYKYDRQVVIASMKQLSANLQPLTQFHRRNSSS